MTDHAHGSSFFQAREASRLRRHYHNHSHLHSKDTDDNHHRLHLHQHRRHLQQHNQHVRSHADSLITPPPTQQPQRRQIVDAVEPVVTQVVRTVSVIQYVDGAGLPIAVSTIFSPPLTQILDPITKITVDTSLRNLPLPTLPSPPPVPVLSPSNSASGNGSGGSTSGSPLPHTTSLSSSQPLLSVTSTPSSASPLPTRVDVFNSTSSTGLFNNSTVRSHFLNTSSTSATPLSSSLLSETTITSSTSSLSSASFTTSRTVDVAGGFTGNGNGGVPTPTSTPIVGGVTPPAAPPPTEILVGGVVGGICGMALLLFAVVFVLRWRRQNGNINRSMLSNGTGNVGNSRGLSNSVSERGIPFAVPAALAALSGKSTVTPAEGEERGFVRVSGRKLPSVLHHGGDGYSNPFADPRDSTMSGGDQSIMYRDSEIFFSPPLGGGSDGGFSPGGSRLKLGSPMRPESGIPVIQPGPARTPVQEAIQSFPVPPPATTALSPSPSPLHNSRDPIGRSHPSLDGSHASRLSQSRFTENIA